MISVQNLTKHFSGKTVVDAVSFSISENSILGLVGRNGAGKTTTLKMLAGTMAASQGEILFGGSVFAPDNPELKKQIGYLPEKLFLYPQLAVIEFLKFCGDMRALKKEFLHQRLSYVVEVCGLKDVLLNRIQTLSKGFKQRVGLAQALLHDPQVLILDEPTEGLDPVQILEIRKVIQDLSQSKKIIFSSHILSEVMKLSHNLVMLDKGKIVFQGAKSDFAENEKALEQKFLELQA